MAVSLPASLMGAKVAPGTLKVGARSRVSARVIQVGKRHPTRRDARPGAYTNGRFTASLSAKIGGDDHHARDERAYVNPAMLGTSSEPFTRDVTDSTPNQPRAIAKIFGALTLALAALAAPLAFPRAAHAAKSSTSAAAAAPEQKYSFNPNLIKLPPAVTDKFDAALDAISNEATALGEGIKAQMNDPWSVEDVWLLLAWSWARNKGRRKLWDKMNGDKTEDDAAFDESFLGWLAGPMKAVWFCWTVLYVHDVFSKILVIPIDDLGFDIGVYILTSGALAIMTTSRFLPNFLETRFKIMEVALKTVITRLTTIAIGVVSVLNAGVCFGLPASSILGVSGVGGLTFGLAAKDILSNFMGGTILAILRPFNVGEEIYITGGANFRGSGNPSVSDYEVKEIGWYQTTLLAKDTKPTTVPNGFFLGANVINVTRATARVLIIDFRVLYQDRDKIYTICDELDAYLRGSSVIDSDKFPVRVNLTSAMPDCLNVQVECHVYKLPLSDHHKAKMKTMMYMMDIVDSHASGVAYPTEVQLETLPALPARK